jgi:hypothetical protein
MGIYDDPYGDAYQGAQNGASEPTQRPADIPANWEWDPKQGVYVPPASVIDAPKQGVTPDPDSPPPPPPDPGPGPGPAGDGTGAAGTTIGQDGTLTEHFKPPPVPFPGATGNGVPTTPQFRAPGYTPPPAFGYRDWTPTSASDVTSDPGYQFGLDQGAQALQQSAASRGLLNSGGTLKHLLQYGNDYATTRFNDVDQRRRADYTMGRANALLDYNTNYGTQYQDPYAIAYRSAGDEFAPEMTGYSMNAQANQRANENAYNNAYQTWHDWQNDTWRKLYDLSVS